MGSLSAWTAQQFDPALNWGDVEWIKNRWGGKLILKGIISRFSCDWSTNDLHQRSIAFHTGHVQDRKLQACCQGNPAGGSQYQDLIGMLRQNQREDSL